MIVLKKYSWMLILCLSTGFYTELIAQYKVVSLWSTVIPDAIKNIDYDEEEVLKGGVLYSTSKVSTPTLSIFLPKKELSNGTAVVICPGGGYSHLAVDKEGFKVAKWLNTLGVTAFVLKYRLPNDAIMKNKTIGPLQDAQEAIRFVRRNAEKWNIKSDKIGIMGFSAGGHLAATLSTHYDEIIYEVSDVVSARPSFSILIYPVISMTEGITHNGSKNNLLGKTPSDILIQKYSNELQVTDKTPPAFLVHATDDGSVSVTNSINYYLALKENNVSAEMHLFQIGGHGFGLGINNTSKNWTVSCENWLKANLYLEDNIK